MGDPLYTYSGPGRMAIYERPEGTDRKAPCLPGSRVHLSDRELAAYDGQPDVSFTPVGGEPAPEPEQPEPPREPAPEPEPQLEQGEDSEPESEFAHMSKSELWRKVKALGLDESLDLSYRESTSEDLIEALSL